VAIRTAVRIETDCYTDFGPNRYILLYGHRNIGHTYDVIRAYRLAVGIFRSPVLGSHCAQHLKMVTVAVDETFTVGSEFNSFVTFEVALREYSKRNNVLYVKRSSEKNKDPTLQHLLYEKVHYTCKQGVSKHRSHASGARPCQR